MSISTGTGQIWADAGHTIVSWHNPDGSFSSASISDPTVAAWLVSNTPAAYQALPDYPSGWYWLVGNKSAPDNIFSAPSGTYVATGDSGYQTFLAAGGTASAIATDGELADLLRQALLPPSLVTACGWTDWGDVAVGDRIATLLYVGVAIESSSQSSLDATYAIDPASLGNLNGIYYGLKVGDPFPDGSDAFNYPDINGIPRGPFDAAHFIDFGQKIKAYVYAVTQIAVGGSVPTTPVSIL